jgi:phenylacetate-CoA ligase
MRVVYHLKKIRDIVRVAAMAKKLLTHDRWTTRELAEHQKSQLSSLIRHAVRHSPFYKELYKNIRVDRPITLDDLPIIGRAEIMDNFDLIVTDPRLKRADLEFYIGRLTHDDYYLGEYRVLTSSGSSGVKGVFVFNRREWCSILAGYTRCSMIMGVTPRLPNRLKFTTIASNSPMHATFRISSSLNIGLYNVQRLDPTSRIENLVAALNEFQPEVLGAYPSIASLLALEQREGRLRIHPRVVINGAELRTDDMEHNMCEAWGVTPFNTYGTIEGGVYNVDCHFHRGIHLFEDLMLVEVVDERNRPVRDGLPGSKLLITNLFNYTQPLIRYEISDMVTISAEPCPCGMPFRLIARIEGKSDDIIYLRSVHGHDVPVHPVFFHTALGAFKEIREFRLVREQDGIDITAVLDNLASGRELKRRLAADLRRNFESLGAVCPEIHIQFVERIGRDQSMMGKVKLVKNNLTHAR